MEAIINQQQIDASMIFDIIHGFVCCTDAHKRHSALESFPQSFGSIPWRRVYKPPAEAPSSSILVMEHWEASELSFGGKGTLWCFTELHRSGENISRKTEDGQSWNSKTGRVREKKGFPSQIRVDTLIKGKAFDMLELTLDHEDKPTVALCKIRRKDNSAAPSMEITTPNNIFGPGASAPHQQVEGLPSQEASMDMQIDQPQGQLDNPAQPSVTENLLSASGYVVVPNSSRDCTVRSIAQDDDSNTGQDAVSTYQVAVSLMHKMIEPFKRFALTRSDEAHKFASRAQNLASSVENALNSPGINTEPERTRPGTSNNLELMEVASGPDNSAAFAPETTTRLNDILIDGYFNDDDYIGLEDFLDLEEEQEQQQEVGTNNFNPDLGI